MRPPSRSSARNLKPAISHWTHCTHRSNRPSESRCGRGRDRRRANKLRKNNTRVALQGQHSGSFVPRNVEDRTSKEGRSLVTATPSAPSPPHLSFTPTIPHGRSAGVNCNLSASGDFPSELAKSRKLRLLRGASKVACNANARRGCRHAREANEATGNERKDTVDPVHDGSPNNVPEEGLRGHAPHAAASDMPGNLLEFVPLKTMDLTRVDVAPVNG